MPSVDSVQTGSFFTTGNELTKDITITSVNTARSLVSITMRTASTVHREKRFMWKAELTTATNIRLTRFVADSTPNITIEWKVEEFASGNTVQSGTVVATVDPTNVTLTAVDLTKSVPYFSFMTDLITGFTREEAPIVEITTTTNLKFDFNGSTPATDNFNAVWQVIDFDSGVTVQAGTTSYLHTASPKDVTITSVDVDKTAVTAFKSSGTSSNVLGRKLTRDFLSSATNVRFENGSTSGTGQTIFISYYIVEFTDSTTVQNGQATITDTNTTLSVTITSVDLNNASLWQSSLWDNLTGDESNGNNPDALHTTRDLTSATNIDFIRNTGDDTVKVAWFVVEWATGAGPGPGPGPGPEPEPGAAGVGAKSSVGLSIAI